MPPKEFGPTFNGITIPESVYLPPEVLQAMPYMTGAELKVTIAALSRTVTLGGWEPITLDDFEALTGLSRPAVQAGLKRALARGILTRYPTRLSTGHLTYVYDIAVAPTTPQLKKLTAAQPVKELSSGVVVDPSSGDQQQLLSPPNHEGPKKLSHPDPDLALVLRRLGVFPRIASQLAAQLPPERVRTAIRLYRLALQAGLAEGPGWLVTLLRDAQRDPARELAELQERLQPRAAAPTLDRPSPLPAEIQEQLQGLHWVGPLDEVEAAWAEDEERVRNLIWYAQQHRLKAGWLRQALRQGFWPPEEELLPETRQRRQQEAHRRSWAAYTGYKKSQEEDDDLLPPGLASAWEAMLAQARQLPEGPVWLPGLIPWRLEEDTLWLRALNPGVAAWFQHHAQALTDWLNAHLEQPARLALGAPK